MHSMKSTRLRRGGMTQKSRRGIFVLWQKPLLLRLKKAMQKFGSIVNDFARCTHFPGGPALPPVVALYVGATPEIPRDPDLGVAVPDRPGSLGTLLPAA